VIANSINDGFQARVVDDFVARTKTRVVQYIPRSLTVTQSELKGKTAIEAAPDSEQARVYRELAERIVEGGASHVPSPLEPAQLRAWAAEWADQLVAQESGEVREARAAI
jgi:nitrogenase iron protein NifH